MSGISLSSSWLKNMDRSFCSQALELVERGCCRCAGRWPCVGQRAVPGRSPAPGSHLGASCKRKRTRFSRDHQKLRGTECRGGPGAAWSAPAITKGHIRLCLFFLFPQGQRSKREAEEWETVDHVLSPFPTSNSSKACRLGHVRGKEEGLESNRRLKF